MTQKDYISRGKPKTNKRTKTGTSNRGKSSAKSKTEQQLPKTKPYIAITLLTFALTGFGYFLWSINGAANNAPVTAQTRSDQTGKPAPIKAPTTAKVEISSSNSQPDIPPPPESEDWQYMNELKHKEVEVAITEVENKGPFLMQCGTFKDGRRAERLKAQLALLGFESRIKVTQGKHTTHHRVQLGPFEMNRDAQRARHKLSKHNINGCKIWLWS